MRKKDINPVVMILFAIIILPVLFIVLFSAQAITFVNDNKPQPPINGYVTNEQCTQAEFVDCEMVISSDGQELWIATE